MEKNIFTDGLIGIGVEAGMIRIDLGTLSATEKNKDGNSVMIHDRRIIIAPEAFGQVYSGITNFMNKMIESGVIEVHENEIKTGGKDKESLASLDQKGDAPDSPNFSN